MYGGCIYAYAEHKTLCLQLSHIAFALYQNTPSYSETSLELKYQLYNKPVRNI